MVLSKYMLFSAFSASLILSAGCTAKTTTDTLLNTNTANVDLVNENINTSAVHPLTLEAGDFEFTLEALKQGEDGVAPTTSFRFVNALALSAEQLKESLNFEPAIAYAMETTDTGDVILTPDAPLEEGSLISAKLAVVTKDQAGATQKKNYSWTYQVQEQFQVISTLPRHRATDVPVDTGIELELSHTDFSPVTDYFTITPAVDGSFEYHRHTIVFVPAQPLHTETFYTVRLAQGVTHQPTGKQLSQDYVFQFETRSSDAPRGTESGITAIHQVTTETSSKEPAYLIVTGDSLAPDQEVQMRLYTLDATQYHEAFADYVAIPRWCRYAPQRWATTSFSTTELPLYAEERVPLKDIGNSWQYAVATPSPLDIGYYYIELDGQGETTLGALLQVTDISAYITTSQTDTVAWVHDALTAEPITGATVTLADGTTLGTTSTTGLLQVPTPVALFDQTVNQAVTITTDARQLVVPLSGNAQGDFIEYWYNDTDTVDTFWSYLYLDQPFFYPDDTINFWGVLDPRDGYSTGEVGVQLEKSSYEDNSAIKRQAVTLGQFGTFEGALDIHGLLPGDYYAVLYNDDHIVFRKYFQVLTVQKPAYRIAIEPADSGVIQGDTFTHTIHAEFFDGTPVSFTDLDVEEKTIQTDQAGQIRYTQTYKRDCYRSSRTICTGDSIMARPAEGEEGEIFGQADVTVFASSQVIDMAVDHGDDNTAVVTGTLFNLDLVGYNSGKYEKYVDPYGDTIAQYPVELAVTRHWSTREQAGSYYDFVQKQAIPHYNYTSHEEEFFRKTVNTDQAGNFYSSFTLSEPDSWYTVTVSAKDSADRTTTASGSIDGNNYYAVDEYKDFHLELQTAANGGNDGERRWTIEPSALGDTVTATMYYGDEPPAAPEQAFLFIQAQNGIRQVTQTDSATYSFTFAEQHIPNVILQGVWYNGRSYWPTSSGLGYFGHGTVVSYQEADRKLQTTATFDRSAYRPGDEVIMDIQVMRPAGTATTAVVNINLIDEAVYAALPEGGMNWWETNYRKDFTEVLYRNVSAGMYSSYASHQYPLELSGAEGGGGWGSRTEFPNKALFKTVTTDASGHAQIRFTLPDSITSWRVNLHAIDGERYAGNNFSSLIVTRPFFVTAVLNERYHVSDRPVIKVRAFGTELSDDNPVTLTVAADSLGMPAQQFTTTGSTAVLVPLPSLAAGTHDLTVTAESGEQGDTIVRRITVAESFLMVPDVTSADIEPNWSPTIPSDRSVDIVFADQYKTQALERLQHQRYGFGDRSDQQAARIIATQLLQQYFDLSYPTETLTATNYQTTESGGISILPYSDADVLVSAHLAASALSDQFDRARLVGYFNSVLTDTSQLTLRHAQALYGLAALREPVLLDIQTMLSSEDIQLTDSLYLALALAQLGAYDQAGSVYDKLFEEFGRSLEDYWYMALGENRTEQLEYTLVAAYIATLLQHGEADALFSYVWRFRPPEVVLGVLAVNTITARLAVLPDVPASIVYVQNGVERVETLADGAVHRVTVLPGDEFIVKAVSGDVQAVVSAMRQPTAEELNTSDTLSITRKYLPEKIKEKDLVKVVIQTTLDSSLPEYDQDYEVIDIIPAGMRLVTSVRGHKFYDPNSGGSWPHLIDGQRVVFHVNRWRTGIVYYLRPINPGKFFAEAPVIQSYHFPHLRNAGQGQFITIEE